MQKNFFVSGEWNITCDICSKKIKAREARQRWDGFIVCPDDFEHRHSQDFVKAQTDKISVPFQRPIPLNTFVILVCTALTNQGLADIGTADCAMVDRDYQLREHDNVWEGK